MLMHLVIKGKPNNFSFRQRRFSWSIVALFRHGFCTRSASVLLALTTIFSYGSRAVWADDPSRAEAVLLVQRCQQAQALLDHVSMRVTNLRDVVVSVGGWPRQQRAEALVRRDGDRLDVSGRYFMLSEKSEIVKDRSHRSRAVITKEIAVWYYCPIGWTEAPKVGIANYDWAGAFAAHGINEITGGPLNGYLPPLDEHRVTEVMAQAADLRLRGAESIDGTVCKVVEAQTRHGKYVLWIAESKGFLPLKVTYDIGPGDLHDYTDRQPFSEVTIFTPEGRKTAGARASGSLDQVTVAKVGDAFVAVSGRFSKTESYGEIQLSNVNTYKYSDIRINPPFQGTDAFVTDLPVGARVNNMADQISGVKYEWREGRARPAGIELGGRGPTAAWKDAAPVSQYLWATVGLVLFGVGGRMAFRSKSAVQAAAGAAREAVDARFS